MPRRSEMRSVRTPLRLTLVLLSAAIFLWGSHAKLSLYEKPSPERSATIAKIVEGKKTISKIAVSASCFPTNLPEGLFVLSIPRSPVTPPVIKGHNHQVGHCLRCAIYLFSTPLFVRPPPLTL